MKYIIAAALLVSGCVVDSEQDTRGSTVKVVMDNSHGSATHIGGGFFITAVHVLDGSDDPKLKIQGGFTVDADVLWSNSKYDIALLHSEYSSMPASRLDCRTPVYGEKISLNGSPLNLEYITTWGTVSGEVTKAGRWDSVVPVNSTLASGMSGGGVFDSDGDLIGVNVGTMVMPIGISGGPVPIGYIVPSEIVCFLMGR